MTVALCRHCLKNKAYAKRGLCSACYTRYRDLYPPATRGVPRGQGRYFPSSGRPEETMEEVEALIAEQLKPENLPPWWKAAVFREQEIEQPVEIVFVKLPKPRKRT